MAKQINFTQILQDEASFQLVRTNPKLTGNVKITVNGDDKMWLNSIDANEELSKSQYKRFPIDTSKTLPGSMFSFFNAGQTPNEIVFDLSENFDSTKTSSDYKDQYDFSHYFSGVKYLSTRRYDEKLSYFAPIFLKQDVPEYFVIFKVKDPLNKPINEIKDSYPFNKEDYLQDLFRKSSIVKTFDLRETTKVGKYLRNYIKDKNFPANPLDVSYDEDSLTEFNGILFNSGVFGKRGEMLGDFYKSSNPLKFFEEFITLGFERNGVIFPNILNMEFIFNDDTSDVYDFNRYVGVYVNAIELSKCDIDLERAYDERGSWENTPRLRREFFDYENVSIEQTNTDGAIIPIKNLEVYLSDFEDIFNDKDKMFFNYLSDKYGNLHLPKLSNPYDIDYNLTVEQFSAKVRMSNEKLNLGDFFGPGESFIQDKGTLVEGRGHSYAYLKVSDLQHLDSLKFYHPNGSRSDANGKYELIEGVSGFSELPDFGDHYAFLDVDNVNGNDVFYFNVDGNNDNRATAIAGCFNAMRNVSIKAFAANDYVFLKITVAGDYDSLYSLEFTSEQLDYTNIAINDITGDTLIDNIINFEGGHLNTNNRIKIDSLHMPKIKSNLSNLLIRTVDGWSTVAKISRNIDAVTDDAIKTKESRIKLIEDFTENSIIAIKENSVGGIEYGDFSIVLKHRPGFGLISFFPIKDFDFDFYSSEYLNFPKIDLFEHYYIPPKAKRLVPGTEYQMYGTGQIKVTGISSATYTSPGTFTISSPSPGVDYEYEVISGDVIVSVPQLDSILSTGDNLWNPVNDQNEELKGFPGFFLLKDPDSVIPEPDTEDLVFELRDKYLNGIATSEYDFYKENASLDFSLKSKVIPYITKWAIPDGLDSRSNPYRLNSELMFGYNNFSPDHEDSSQNPSNFTHEWYYIESKFSYADDVDTIKLNNSYFDEPFILNKALTESGYFIDYFTYTPKFNGDEIGKTQTRYTPITKNNLGIYEAFFKGFKISFKDYIDATNLDVAGKPIFNPNSTRYEGYKFTCLLQTIKEDINDDSVPPIRYRFIEHKDFKFVILLIELRIGDRSNLSSYWEDVNITRYDNLTNDVTAGTELSVLDNIPLTSNPAYNSINGDYRIQFDTVDGVDISNLTHTLLYSLKHKKFNLLNDNFANIKLSVKLNLNASGAFNSSENLDVIPNHNFTKYPADLKDEVGVLNDKTFIIVNDNALSTNRIIDLVNGFTPANISKFIGAETNFAIYDTQGGSNQIGLVDADSNSFITPLPSTLSTAYIKENLTFKIMNGGELYFENLLSKLSFGEFKEFTNLQNAFIEYESYSYDTSLKTETANWYAEIPDASSIEKTDAIIAISDINKPSLLAFTPIIGYTYERSNLDNSYEINRYSGGFSPLFKDIFSFNSKFSFNKNDIETLDLSNTRFNIDVPNFLNIDNFSHIKISDTKILDLESDEEFEPKYELSNEIAIARESYDLLTSNWDYGFHHKYTTKSNKIPVAGTLRVEEDDSFVAKIINLRDNIELEQFKVSKVADAELVDLNNFEIVYQENDNSISGKINIQNALITYLLADGIGDKFNEFLVNSSEYIGNFEKIEDYVIEYIKLNIIKLYEMIEIEFYSKDDKTIDNNLIEFKLLTDSERNDLGYKLNKNLKINKLDRFTLNFEFTKSLDSGTLVSPKIKIKFI